MRITKRGDLNGIMLVRKFYGKKGGFEDYVVCSFEIRYATWIMGKKN